jgi:hypothetical protein
MFSMGKLAELITAKETRKTKTKKKPGRVANPNLVTTSILLEKDLLTWGKAQPEGLSALVRRLLRREMEAKK